MFLNKFFDFLVEGFDVGWGGGGVGREGEEDHFEEGAEGFAGVEHFVFEAGFEDLGDVDDVVADEEVRLLFEDFVHHVQALCKCG